MARVDLAAVWKLYGAVEAVRDLTLACADGTMLALLGPSGCGKSSTLKMIAGIEAVSRGDIRFDDRSVSALAPGARNIAMVFEDYALYPHLSVFENVAFPLRLRRAPAAEVARRVGDALDLLGLAEVRDDNVRRLSGGAQQRVAIGRALVREPAVVLFDEPLSHLDADQKIQLRAEIKRLQTMNRLTSILVTHDQTEAIAMADRVAVLNLGVLQQLGTPDELYARPANLFVAGFIGEPPMNLLAAEAAAENGGCVLRGAGWRIAATMGDGPGRVIAGIRPEDVGVTAADAGGDALGTVFFREPRGDADVLVVDLDDGARVVAEVAGPSPWRAGDRVALAFPPARLHLFDPESGRAYAGAAP